MGVARHCRDKFFANLQNPAPWAWVEVMALGVEMLPATMHVGFVGFVSPLKFGNWFSQKYTSQMHGVEVVHFFLKSHFLKPRRGHWRTFVSKHSPKKTKIRPRLKLFGFKTPYICFKTPYISICHM